MKRYVYGTPIETGAVVCKPETTSGNPEDLSMSVATKEDNWTLSLPLEEDDIVYGLGETVRGINKRGWKYISWSTDEFDHSEGKNSLYGAHNFLIIAPKPGSDRKPVGLFIDQPGKVTYDIGYQKQDEMTITCDSNLELYVIEGSTAYDIAKKFRSIIGKPYLAPRFGFGYGQSRWGYKTKEDFYKITDKFNELNMPVDMIYMDIDYMQDFEDFTLNEKEFADDFPGFVQKMKDKGIRLIPIIDAGIKMLEGYGVYEEGAAKNYFCKLEDHKTDFTGAVWPGYAAFPDFLNPEARNWFGMKYKILTDAGIEGFWNDMNEPALFYSAQGMQELKEYLTQFANDPAKPVNCYDVFDLNDHVGGIKNSMKDYERFYHNMDGQWIRHDKVHNLYGSLMTKAATDAFKKLRPEQRTLMFSRASTIGGHRDGGIWTGDNVSWWSHLGLLVHQLPAINMSGFLYTGADLGGFGQNTTRDLVLRFMQIGMFTPLMRNHAALGTREQEPYQFEHPEDFTFLIEQRYRLIPYLYSEYLKAIKTDDMMFRPLAFDFPEDPIAREVEDQLLFGHELMIAPVLEQNKTGRMVYLPESMMEVRFAKDQPIQTQPREAGWHYICYPLNELVFFVRNNKAIPVAEHSARRVDEINDQDLTLIGYPEARYVMVADDGISLDPAKAGYHETVLTNV